MALAAWQCLQRAQEPVALWHLAVLPCWECLRAGKGAWCVPALRHLQLAMCACILTHGFFVFWRPLSSAMGQGLVLEGMF